MAHLLKPAAPRAGDDGRESGRIDATFSESDYPALFLSADAVSRRGQQGFVRFTRIELSLLVLASAFGAAISFLGVVGDRVVAASVAIVLLAATIVRSYMRSTDPSRGWFEGRAVAESVKSLSWKYMTHVSPLDVHGTRADDAFTELLGEVVTEHVTLALPRDAQSESLLQQITPGMRRVRSLTFHGRRQLYLDLRVRDQLRWYSRRARDHKRTADRWFIIGVASEIAAIAYAVLLVVTPTWPNVIGLLSTVTAASATLARLRGDSEVAQRYTLAAQELGIIQHRIESATEETFAQRVVEAEGAISREHMMWAAKRD